MRLGVEFLVIVGALIACTVNSTMSREHCLADRFNRCIRPEPHILRRFTQFFSHRVTRNLQRYFISNIFCKLINEEDTELIAILRKDSSPVIHITAPYVEQYSEDGVVSTAILAPNHANRMIKVMAGIIVERKWSTGRFRPIFNLQVSYFLCWPGKVCCSRLRLMKD